MRADALNSMATRRSERHGRETHERPVHRVVIIGAGFGGLASAKALARAPVEVTIVDQRNYHTFQPLLYEVATAGLDPADVAYPVRAAIGRASNIRFRLGAVTGVDWDERTVCFAGSDVRHDSASDGCADDIPFDSLIIATGAVVRFFDVPGAAEHAHPLYTLDDARHLRDHILLRLEEADEQVNASDGTLTFAIVGGGPTGVELAGAIGDLLDQSIHRDGFRFDRTMARVVLIDGLDHLLTAFAPRGRRYAEATLRRRGVELKLGETVSRVTATEVELADGAVILARTVIWAGGVTARGTVASALGSNPTRDGRLVVGSDLTVPMHDGVFAIGDSAAIPRAPGSDRICPQLSPVAIQSGRHAASLIVARQLGTTVSPFRYRDKGIMATIGRRAAIAQLRRGLMFQGTAGWVTWFVLHLVYLVGFRNRVTVLVNWAWRYLRWTSGPRIIVGDRPEPWVGPDTARSS
jgi:NADH dehydrogenase